MTTIVATPPLVWAVLEEALKNRCPVWLSYHGRRRLICPHALGWNNGRPMVLGYQTGGQTSTGALPSDPRQRWRLFFVDKLDQVEAAEAADWGAADNYNPARPFNSIDHVGVAICP